MSMQRADNTESKTNLKRHRHGCSICNHERCEEIERAFVGWASPAKIAEEYGLPDRSSVYRHAHALGLFDARRKNVRAALEKLIERAGDVDVTVSALVAAIQALAKISTEGLWIDRTEISLGDLFRKMSPEELDAYAKTGTLPVWFRAAIGATGLLGQKGANV